VTANGDFCSLAAQAIGLLERGGRTICTAESVTGGLIAAALTSIPGSSAVVRGGIVAYSADVKTGLLGVPDDLIERVGTVHRDVATAMAHGARELLGADVAVAVTGIAGPEPVDGQPVGTVHVALDAGDSLRQLPLRLDGDRRQIRHDTVTYALRLLVDVLAEDNR
jgi:nicotinamide-nucleotide amidase